MTGFQLARPGTGSWTVPARKAVGSGRHASNVRATLTVRRLFYLARHAARGW
jgi:hypothetical protein